VTITVNVEVLSSTSWTSDPGKEHVPTPHP
jgi:hypothetical protein